MVFTQSCTETLIQDYWWSQLILTGAEGYIGVPGAWCTCMIFFWILTREWGMKKSTNPEQEVKEHLTENDFYSKKGPGASRTRCVTGLLNHSNHAVWGNSWVSHSNREVTETEASSETSPGQWAAEWLPLSNVVILWNYCMICTQDTGECCVNGH